ncbi:hypothetical protein D3C80_1779630 [compost metagenome]
MRAALQRNDGAQHRQPEEQDAGQFIGPGDRRMQDIAREGATAQDGDLGKHDQRGRNLHDPAHGAAPHGKGGAWFLRCAS